MEATSKLESEKYLYEQEKERRSSIIKEQKRLSKQLQNLDAERSKVQEGIDEIDKGSEKLKAQILELKTSIMNNKNEVKKCSKSRKTSLKTESQCQTNVKKLQSERSKLIQIKNDLMSRIERIKPIQINMSECHYKIDTHVSIRKYNAETIQMLKEKISNLSNECDELQGRIQHQQEINDTIRQFLKN